MPGTRSILIVVDDRATREMLGSLFREQGSHVAEVGSADEATKALGETEFDLVLSDIKMPGESGLGPDALPIAPSPKSVAAPAGGGDLRECARQGRSLHDVEELYIREILAETGGNKVRAARILGIDRKTLYRRAERSARSSGAGEAEKETP